MTCVLPAQSLTYREPTSRAPAVELVRTPEDSVATAETTILDAESSQYTAAFLAASV